MKKNIINNKSREYKNDNINTHSKKHRNTNKK